MWSTNNGRIRNVDIYGSQYQQIRKRKSITEEIKAEETKKKFGRKK